MSVTLRFCGAARTVTGSCYLVETASGRFLIDCGLFQGQKTLKELNYGAFPFRPADVDAVLLTHAHIDHSGMLPKLVREGFDGSIFATRGTIDLCSVMLPDAGNIQEFEVATLNRRNAARGRSDVTPIYTEADAVASLRSFRPVDYESWIDVMPGVRARYWNAGHLLGSASIEIECADAARPGRPLRLLASGDIGPEAKLLQPDPKAPAAFDYVISESTYGDRIRPATTPQQRRERLAAEVRDAANARGAMLIPAFAVERTQELLVDLVGLMERGEVPAAPVFLDSPLAIQATDVFRKHAASLDSDVDINRIFASPHLRFTETVNESKAIAKLTGFHIVVAASGMCDAGRVKHHLRHNLRRRECSVLITGFQAQGTLGRRIVDGAKSVRIHGDEVEVRAEVATLGGFSAHADQSALTAWLRAFERPPARVCLVHGEEDVQRTFAAHLKRALGWEVDVPAAFSRVDLRAL